MDSVVLHAESNLGRRLATLLGGYQVHLARGTRELVETLVSEPAVAAIVEKLRPDRRFIELLSSLSRSFPALRVAVIHAGGPPLPEGYVTLQPGDRAEDTVEQVRGFLASVERRERRRHRRFDWPLRGELSLDGQRWRSYNLRTLGSGGAFLESGEALPRAGSKGWLRVLFQDFRMLTGCEVLDPRRASSNLPAGFGVRFTDLTPAATSFIDSIVQDALVQSLLDPDSEPAIPSIGEEELLTGTFELL